MSSSRSLVSTWAPTSVTRTTQKPSTTSWPFPTTTEEWEEAIVSLISSISPFQLAIWFSMVISSLCRHRLRQEQRRWPLVPFRWLQCNSNGRGNCCGNAISLFLARKDLSSSFTNADFALFCRPKPPTCSSIRGEKTVRPVVGLRHQQH